MVARNSWKRLSLPIIIVLTLMAMLLLLINGQTAVIASPPAAVLTGSETATAIDIKAATNDIGTTAHANQASSDQATSEKTTYIVVLKDEALARYSGGIAHLPGTSRQATGAAKLNARASESVSYLAYLADQRSITIKQIGILLGRELDVSYEYGATIVGFASEMTAAEAAQVAQLANVSFVEEEQISYPQTDSGPIWSGAADVWGGAWNALSYQAELSGNNEVPAVVSTALGEAEFTYNFYTNALSYTIQVENPSGISLTMMHIHSGTVGTVGGVIYNFGITPTMAGFTETGVVNLSDSQETTLVNKGLYINVHSIDNGSGEIRGQIELYGTLGEGIVVGVIDTGIDPWNPSFSATGGDGYVHTNPLGVGNYLGVCDPNNVGNSDVVGYDATFPCNDKLIGVWGYTASDLSPRDADGHGSHTASTAAGNIVFGTTITAPTKVFQNDISGMAPHANIIAYDGCADGLGCPQSATNAARDQALLDGVDVINYSIGNIFPTGNLWQENSEALQWLALREAGIFVATSNGNAGNKAATTGSPSDLPWITSVGASSHNRAYLVTLELTNSFNMTATVQGQAMTGEYGPANIVFSNSITDTEFTRLCEEGAFAPGTFDGEIVICEAGEISPFAKAQSVLDGGAGGLVIAEPIKKTGGPGSVTPNAYKLPAANIDYSNYQILRQFLITTSTGTVTGTLSGASVDIDNVHGDIMATFSSRGPNGSAGDLIVPNVTAPGRAIWAAYSQGPNGDGDYTYNVIQGTSMASPHVAGAAALLTALHPTWTPAEIESALMLTAFDEVRDDDGVTKATPFAQGSGHIVVARAAYSPLVMHVTAAEYKAADPMLNNGFEVRDLNIASFAEDGCIGICVWQRIVKNVSDETLTWGLYFDAPVSVGTYVSPSVFTLAPGESQTIDIGLDVNNTGFDEEWHFGSLILDESSDEYPDAHLPFAVYPSKGNFPESIKIESKTISGSINITELVSLEITDLNLEVSGLVTADRHELTVMDDGLLEFTTGGLFFQAITTTQFVSVEVPADSFSVIAETVESTSEVLVALLFLDIDNNGPDVGDIGDLSDQFFFGTKGNVCLHFFSPLENNRCEILDPPAGTYYVAVLNRGGSNGAGDYVDLATAVVPKNGPDAGNLVVSGPTAVGNSVPYTLTLDYNEPEMEAIDKLYGYFSVGTDLASAGDLASIPVYLTYLGAPEISLEPETLTLARDASTQAVTTTLTLSATGGVLDWNIDKPAGVENVQDGSFEAGSVSNPYWGYDSSRSFPLICSLATCNTSLAFTGDWYGWIGGGSPQRSYLEQEVTIEADDYALLSFQMIMGGSITSTGVMTVSLDGDVIETYSAADMQEFSGYQKQTFDVSDYADGGVYTLAFDFDDPGTDLINFFIDDVSIRSSSCLAIDDIPWLDINLKSGILSPGSVDLIASFSALDLDAGDHAEMLCVNSNDPDEPILHLPVTMTINAATPEVSTAVSEMTTMGGQMVTYTVNITNSGSADDTFDVVLSGNDWPAVASSESGFLESGATAQFDVVVTIPLTAAVGSMDSVTVTVVSQADGSKAGSVALTTSMQVYQAYLPVVTRN